MQHERATRAQEAEATLLEMTEHQKLLALTLQHPGVLAKASEVSGIPVESLSESFQELSYLGERAIHEFARASRPWEG